MAGMFAGCALGLGVSAVAGGAGVALTTRSARARPYVWWTFAAVFVVVLSLCLVAVHQYPYGTARPGSDYDIVMKNLFLEWFGYCASPGVAALVAAVATLLMPRKLVSQSPESDQTTTPRQRGNG